MEYKQVKDVLQRAIDFHGLLKDFYKKIDDTTQKDTVKLLVDYMARHEKQMQDITSQISAEQEKRISEEWFKCEPEFATGNCFDRIKIDKDSSVDDVIDAGLQLNQCLINLFHHVAEVAPTKEIETLFRSLETGEIAEKKKLARMRGM